ncbi:MAG TPA: GerMN domain-containing protein [Thermoanaerobaculia bacterium]|nr:GerMN domain-containing protein [Thermoanaerobaculia bacterium]
MSRRAAAIFLLVMGAAVAGLLYLTRSSSPTARSRRTLPFLRVTPAASGAVAPAPSGTAVPVETVRVTLFFADAAQGKLHPEERDVPKPPGPGAYLRTLFEELARGPSRPGLVGVIPPRLQLRNGFLLANGEVVLDLAVDASLSFGSAEELSIVASLVDTVLQNVANTRRVRILVNGEPVESLGGHVDLTRPLSFVRSELAS